MIRRNSNKRILILSIFNLACLGFIVFMFYNSEPKYINDSYHRPQVWDYVSVASSDPYNKDFWFDGVVVQTDSTSFTMRYRAGMTSLKDGGLYTFNYKMSYYKVLGQGTFYHKVNAYIGFNIMLITTLIIFVFFVVAFYTQLKIIYDLLM